MNFNKNILTGITLLASGTYKTYLDYKNTPKEQKQRTFVRNLSVLGTATTAVFTADYLAVKLTPKLFSDYSSKISKRISDIKFFKIKQLSQSKISSLTNILLNCTKDFFVGLTAVGAGVFGGFLSDKILDKVNISNQNYIPEKYAKSYKKFSSSFDNVMTSPVLSTITNDGNRNAIITATKVFDAAGFFHNPFDSTGVILSSYDMAKEKNLKKIVEKTSIEILANSLIPAMFVSIVNSISKDKNMLFKLPLLAASFYLGDIVGKKISNKLNK